MRGPLPCRPNRPGSWPPDPRQVGSRTPSGELIRPAVPSYGRARRCGASRIGISTASWTVRVATIWSAPCRGEAGIRQFLDIGTGLPTASNTHEVAQAVAPESRIVYVDNDPLVLVHARALLTSSPQGATDYIEADLRDPDKILDGAAATLDFEEPIALMLLEPGVVSSSQWRPDLAIGEPVEVAEYCAVGRKP